jgi:hypothetical protein
MAQVVDAFGGLEGLHELTDRGPEALDGAGGDLVSPPVT